MELDTGASVSLISEQAYHATWTDSTCLQLKPLDACFCTYSSEIIKVLSAIDVNVMCKNHCRQLSLLVVPNNGPTPFSRDWLKAISLD